MQQEATTATCARCVGQSSCDRAVATRLHGGAAGLYGGNAKRTGAWRQRVRGVRTYISFSCERMLRSHGAPGRAGGKPPEVTRMDALSALEAGAAAAAAAMWQGGSRRPASADPVHKWATRRVSGVSLSTSRVLPKATRKEKTTSRAAAVQHRQKREAAARCGARARCSGACVSTCAVRRKGAGPLVRRRPRAAGAGSYRA